VVLGVLATVALLIGVAGLAGRRQPPARPAGVSVTGLGAPDGSSYPTAPTLDVQRIHTALHDMGARCTPGADAGAKLQIGRDVDELISFARTYPDARFSVDGENGQALNLLLIARDEMRSCAPAAAARANQELPPQYRTSASAPPSAVSGAPTGK
jgi:hypothetical protein